MRVMKRIRRRRRRRSNGYYNIKYIDCNGVVIFV
jgi:hypothetical protein